MDRLQRFLDGEAGSGSMVRLTMDAREPFPAQRIQILRRQLDILGGRILSADGRTVYAELSPGTNPRTLEALFHWECRPADAGERGESSVPDEGTDTDPEGG